VTDPAGLLARYLRQRQELGEHELILESAPLDRSIGRGRAVAAATSERQHARGATPPASGAASGERAGPRPRSAHADAWRELQVAAMACTACELSLTRSTVVFGEGDPAADLVVVGEAPGAEEDRTGRPFVGRAGRLLDKLLASIGLEREAVYICNVLKCRPPQNRNPLSAEVEACSGFLRGQLVHVAPRAILACGTFPAQTLLSSTEAIGRLRGRPHDYAGIPLVPTYHPAALLRNPAWIRPVWEDLQRLRALLDA
jgi:uracil-DNA glycosylase